VEFSRELGGIWIKAVRTSYGRSTRFPLRRQQDAIDQMAALGVDSLVVLGRRVHAGGARSCRPRVQVAGIPATIDNDIWGTEATWVRHLPQHLLDAVSKLRDTASPNRSRCKVMGRESGVTRRECCAWGAAADLFWSLRRLVNVSLPLSISLRSLAGQNCTPSSLWRGAVGRRKWRRASVSGRPRGSVSVLGHIPRGGTRQLGIDTRRTDGVGGGHESGRRR
jgi:6-phosphofructokinase 1